MQPVIRIIMVVACDNIDFLYKKEKFNMVNVHIG